MDVKFGIYRNLMLILSDAQLTNLEGNEPLQIQYQLPRYCFKYDCQQRSKNIMKP